jgi:hypothetical protein
MSNNTKDLQTETAAAAEGGGIRRFFSNPVVGFVGSVASLIGLGLAVYFYLESRAYRELRYFVNPARAVVVHAGQTSRLAITLDGALVKHDISAAQVAFWNEGRSAIKPDNMLRQLVVKTSSTAPIIDATIRKKSRDVVKIELDKSRLALGELTVFWNILEFHDGGVLQIIYLGSVDTPVVARATIEGQGDLPSGKTGGSHKNLWWLSIIVGAMVGIIINLLHSLAKRNKRIEPLFLALTSGVTALFVWRLVNYYLSRTEVGPPFGF